jgi:hypothetical protein
MRNRTIGLYEKSNDQLVEEELQCGQIEIFENADEMERGDVRVVASDERADIQEAGSKVLTSGRRSESQGTDTEHPLKVFTENLFSNLQESQAKNQKELRDRLEKFRLKARRN